MPEKRSFRATDTVLVVELPSPKAQFCRTAGAGRMLSNFHCSWGPPPTRANIPCALRRDLAVAGRRITRPAEAGTPTRCGSTRSARPSTSLGTTVSERSESKGRSPRPQALLDEAAAAGRKPNSVPFDSPPSRLAALRRVAQGDDHSSSPAIAGGIEQPTRKLRTGSPRTLPYLALLRAGFCLPPVLPRARCALTAPFHPY